ncbi:MAG: hypothetical protein RIT28_3653, partial [Pseudomonadota bacterium]
MSDFTQRTASMALATELMEEPSRWL